MPPPSYWRNHWGRWGFVVVGLVSLVWFLVRVLPKPRRAAYPCQQVAAPLAGSFLAWLGLLVFSSAVWNQSNTFLQRFRRGSVAAYVALAVLLVLVVVIRMPMPSAHADVSPLDSSSAIGTGKGIHPGRVVWVHNPQATDGSVYTAPQYWWQTNHTDGAVVEQMFSQAIRSLTGQGTNDATAWDALFHNFNETHGRGYTGYTAGEKIAIKLNLVSCMDIAQGTHNKTNDINTNGSIKENRLLRIDPSPQMIGALLRHLVGTVGVAQTNIFLGDPTSVVPHYYWDLLHEEFPDIHWIENLGGDGRERAEFSAVPVYWSTNAADGKLQDYLPSVFADADYIINFAVLKWHTCGVTLCGKNNYGSLIRTPVGSPRMGSPTTNYFDMHLSLPNVSYCPGTEHYRAIVDLMGHPDLGGKTILYLIDGLYSGLGWKSISKKWNSYPFGSGVVSNCPSSLFLSQDPVAIDSVAYDFLFAEWPDMVRNGQKADGTFKPSPTANALQGGAEDYLHEAALAHSPLSGTFYDSDRDGVRMASLGVHEHWNDSTNKQYSRNLGLSEGIELVAITSNSVINLEPQPDMRIQIFAATNTLHAFTFRSLTPGLSYTVQDCTSLLNNGWTNIGTFTANAHEMAWSRQPSNGLNTLFYRLQSN